MLPMSMRMVVDFEFMLRARSEILVIHDIMEMSKLSATTVPDPMIE